MSWNHRVVDMTAENEGDPLFEIREVYYEGDKPVGHCEPSVMSETMEGLVEMLDRMKEALDQPVLKEPEDFREEKRVGSVSEVWYVDEGDGGFQFVSFVFETKIEAEKYARAMFPEESEDLRYARIHCKEVFSFKEGEVK